MTFVYCSINAEEKQKSIDIETICQLLDIVMGSTFRAQVDYFVEYLKVRIAPNLIIFHFQNVYSQSYHPMIGFFCLFDTDPKRLQSYKHGSMDGLLPVLQ